MPSRTVNIKPAKGTDAEEDTNALPDYIPAAKKYKTSLYIINGFIAFIALGLLCLGAWAYYADAGLVIREAYPSLIIFLIACSAIAFLVASAGISGAYNAVKRIRQEEMNGCLLFYLMALILVCLCEIAIAAVLLSLNGVVDNSMAQENSAVVYNSMENSIRDWAATHEADWKSLQDSLECCGYSDMEVDAGLKTGDLCLTAPDTVSCRKLIFSKAEDMIIVLAAFGLFIAVVELIALVSSSCLLCCFKKTD